MKPFLVLLAAILLLAGTPLLPLPSGSWSFPWTFPSVTAPAVTSAVYVYEKNDGPIPPGVLSGIDRLNRERNIVASVFEDDSTDGTGEVPEQYRPALAAAKAASIPALVVLSGTTSIKVVPKPLTEEQVVRAVP